MSATVQVKVGDTKRVERLLTKLPVELRTKALNQAVRAAGRIVANQAKQLCPKPGYRGDKQGLKPLRDTIGVVVRDYANGPAAIVGPQYPAGAHGHLVEFGHDEVLWGQRTGRRVKPKPFLRPAADQTKSQQQAALIAKIKAGIDKAARSG